MKRGLGGLLGILALASCHLGVDEEQPWNLRERRQFFEGARGLPRSALEPGQFEIVVPLGVEARQLALAARDALTVQRGALVQGVSSSMGAVDIETGARVGHLYALGESAPVLGERAILQGYLRSRPEHAAPHVQPRLGVVRDAPVAAERFAWQVAFSAVEPGDCIPEPSPQTLGLEPSAYGELLIGAGVSVALRTGHYHFAALSLLEGGRLELENVAGPIYLWIDRALALEGRVAPDFPDGNTLFGYAGTAPVTVTGLEGTLVAPGAEVRVRAGLPSTGAIFAARIVLENKAAFVHRPFEVAPPDADILATCQRCARERDLRPNGELVRVRPDCIDCPVLSAHAPRRYRNRCTTAPGG